MFDGQNGRKVWRRLAAWLDVVNRRVMPTPRLDHLADLTDPASLGVVSMREEPLSTVGFYGLGSRMSP
jgi:hypothetical protein